MTTIKLGMKVTPPTQEELELDAEREGLLDNFLWMWEGGPYTLKEGVFEEFQGGQIFAENYLVKWYDIRGTLIGHWWHTEEFIVSHLYKRLPELKPEEIIL